MILYMLGFLWVILLIATFVAFVFDRIKHTKETHNVIIRVKSWWVIIGLFSLIFVGGNIFAVCFFGGVCLLAMYEIYKRAGFSIIMLVVLVSMGSCAFLYTLPRGDEFLFFLMVITQSNDIAQYLWGKSLGKKKILPNISPSKTWEGFLGGMFTSSILAYILATYITPFGGQQAVVIGLLLGFFGFWGDAFISAFKRSLKIKDMGNMIPGHGGIMDRIDSLLYNGPLFLLYVLIMNH